MSRSVPTGTPMTLHRIPARFWYHRTKAMKRRAIAIKASVALSSKRGNSHFIIFPAASPRQSLNSASRSSTNGPLPKLVTLSLANTRAGVDTGQPTSPGVVPTREASQNTPGTRSAEQQ